MYADDFAMVGTDASMDRVFSRLLTLGPPRGYFPKPEKSILIMRDKTRASPLLTARGFRPCEGHRYVGSFIGTEAARREWLTPQIRKWKQGVKLLGATAKKYPQTAYAGLTRSFQMEWAYLQRVLPNMAREFRAVEMQSTSTSCWPSFRAQK